MFCTQCGKEIVGEVKFCPFCGTELYTQVNTVLEQEKAESVTVPYETVQPAYQETAPVYEGQVPDSMQPVPMPRLRTGLGGGIVYTILSIFFFSPLSFLTGVLAIIFGGIAKGKKNKGNTDGARGHARAAKSLNVTSLILLILWIAMIVVFCVLCVQAYQQIESSGVLDDLTPEGVQEWLRGYGYDVDLDDVEEFFNELPQGTFNIENEDGSFNMDWQFAT